MSWLDAIAAPWLDALGHLLWQTSLLIVLAWLIERTLLRGRLAGLRAALWTAVAARFLLPPSITTPVSATTLLDVPPAALPTLSSAAAPSTWPTLLLCTWGLGVLVLAGRCVIAHEDVLVV